MSENKPVKAEGNLAQTEGDSESPKRSWISWALGWVAVPGVVLGGIFGGGVVVGANFADSWVTSMCVWIGELF